jgi:hypothetical protein
MNLLSKMWTHTSSLRTSRLLTWSCRLDFLRLHWSRRPWSCAVSCSSKRLDCCTQNKETFSFDSCYKYSEIYVTNKTVICYIEIQIIKPLSFYFYQYLAWIFFTYNMGYKCMQSVLCNIFDLEKPNWNKKIFWSLEILYKQMLLYFYRCKRQVPSVTSINSLLLYSLAKLHCA